MNAKPYLGKNYDDNRSSQQLGEYVVMTLSEPYLHRGHNITTDNFFTSKKLADRLLEKKTTLVGTVKANRKELPPPFTDPKRKLHSVLQGYCVDSSALLLSIKAKKTKIVNVLSTMHKIDTVPQDGRSKPSVIDFYNKTKGGVDSVDQMCHHYSTKSSCRRWPVHVFNNMLDITSVNAFTLYQITGNTDITSRRAFILKLAEDLTRHCREARNAHPLQGGECESTCRVRCKQCGKNKT